MQHVMLWWRLPGVGGKGGGSGKAAEKATQGSYLPQEPLDQLIKFGLPLPCELSNLAKLEAHGIQHLQALL